MSRTAASCPGMSNPLGAEPPRLPPQPWLTAPETRAVVAALTADGGRARFVGGCVRDALAGRAVGDVDFATPDPPERVLARLAAARIKAVPTGIAHGTVTAVVGGRPFEITTLRRDVATDGRRATVAFTDDWEADAARRDFTINAMSADPDGTLHDRFGGAADLAAGRVRFVGDPDTRLEEDHLRLLRFFRFHARFGRGAPDEAALAACRRWAPKLARLSAERVRAELLKLLGAPDPAPTVATMLEGAILAAVLREIGAAAALARLVALERPRGLADPLRRLAALLPRDARIVDAVGERLRMSNAERARLAAVSAPGPDPADAAALAAALYRDGVEAVRDRLLLDAAAAPAPPAAIDAALTTVERWNRPSFPLRGEDVMALGVAGPRVGQLLAAVESWWMAGGFRADRAACLAELRRIVG